MNAPRDGIDSPPDWTAANQGLLAAEFGWLRACLGDAGDAGAMQAERDAAATAMPAPAAIDIVTALFGLSPFERALLLLCAGVEMDARLAEALLGASQRLAPTFGFALGALPDAHWSALTPARPLRRWRLIELEPGLPLSTTPLRIDERLLHFLAGINQPDAHLSPLLRSQPLPALTSPAQHQLARQLADDWRRIGMRPIQLYGDDGDGAVDVAALFAAELGLQLQTIRGEDLPAGGEALDTFITLWKREAGLLGAALLVRCEDSAPPAALALAEQLQAPLLIAARQPAVTRVPSLRQLIDKPDATEQRRLWRQALGDDAAIPGAVLDTVLDIVCSQFRLSAAGVEALAAELRADLDAGLDPAASLLRHCRISSRARLDELAQRIDAQPGWQALVLPEPQLASLRQIVAQARNRQRVYGDWGFRRDGERGRGISVLFAGESGTGKTLAAEVLAGELGLDLYRIDLSGVVSKYIGETEKNLRRVFDAAEDSGAILLFDEADALFGKRSEVKDSHDRYANIEVSYLLQRMEAYSGLAILTTNLKSALDGAFQRRLRFVVQFPFPDPVQREAIWRRSFPAQAPVGALDYARLARLHFAGGAISNIALNAALLAADADCAIGMPHLRHAALAETAKLNRAPSELDFRGWP